jgi:hypothetical protein
VCHDLVFVSFVLGMLLALRHSCHAAFRVRADVRRMLTLRAIVEGSLRKISRSPIPSWSWFHGSGWTLENAFMLSKTPGLLLPANAVLSQVAKSDKWR